MPYGELSYVISGKLEIVVVDSKDTLVEGLSELLLLGGGNINELPQLSKKSRPPKVSVTSFIDGLFASQTGKPISEMQVNKHSHSCIFDCSSQILVIGGEGRVR